MNNQEHLEKWLNDSLFKTKEQIREYSQWAVDSKLYQSEISMLEYRKEWLETQISSFQQFPIGFSGKTKLGKIKK